MTSAKKDAAKKEATKKDVSKKDAVKKTAAEKRKPLEKRKMTTSRYIDDTEGVTVIKRPTTPKKGK